MTWCYFRRPCHAASSVMHSTMVGLTIYSSVCFKVLSMVWVVALWSVRHYWERRSSHAQTAVGQGG